MPGGRITLNPSYGTSVTAIVGGTPDRAGGVGGWESSERSRRRPAKWWKGQPDDTASYDLILDVDADVGGTIAQRLRNLRNMGVPHSNHDEPPTVELSGDVWATDGNITWVIEDISLGDRLFDSDGTFRRYAVTVSLSRFDEVDEVEAISIRRTRGKKNTKRRYVITTRAGDTMRGVALRELGSGSRWKELRAWNHKKLGRVNPDVRLRTGTRLAVH